MFKNLQDLEYSKKYSVMTILGSIPGGIFGPMYGIYLKEMGLSLFTMNFVNFIYMVVLTITDPPTGRLGDRKGHVRVYLSGIFIWIFSSLLYGIGSSFGVFIAAETVGAIGSSLRSNALLSRLANNVDEDDYNRIKANASLWSGRLGVLVTAGSPFLVKQIGSLNSAWYLAAGSFLIIFLVGVFIFRNECNEEREFEIENGKESKDETSLKEAYIYVWNNRKLRFIILMNFTIYFSFQAINMYWPLRFTELGGGVEWLGVMFAIARLAIAQGKGMSKRYQPAKIGVNTHLVQICYIILSLLIASLTNSVLLYSIFLIIHEFPRGTLEEITNTYQNYGNTISKKDRAMLNSVLSATKTLGAAMGLLIIGAVAFYSDIQTSWILSCFCMGLFVIGNFKFRNIFNR
jgi:MFS family permease